MGVEEGSRTRSRYHVRMDLPSELPDTVAREMEGVERKQSLLLAM